MTEAFGAASQDHSLGDRRPALALRLFGLYLAGAILLSAATLWLGGWLFPSAGARWLIAPASVLTLLAVAVGTRRSPERLRAIMLSALAGTLLYVVSVASGVMLTADAHQATAAELLGGSFWMSFAMLLVTGLPLAAFIVAVVVGAVQRLLVRKPRAGQRYL